MATCAPVFGVAPGPRKGPNLGADLNDCTGNSERRKCTECRGVGYSIQQRQVLDVVCDYEPSAWQIELHPRKQLWNAAVRVECGLCVGTGRIAQNACKRFRRLCGFAWTLPSGRRHRSHTARVRRSVEVRP